MECVVVDMMTRENLLWRCLHGGALNSESLEHWGPEESLPFADLRARNVPILENLMDIYGACAVAARAGNEFVGHLRFYPKAVREAEAASRGMCLQQAFPYGPPGDFGLRAFPPLPEIEDKTLVVHCMMLAPRVAGEEDLKRKGIGTRMARVLIDWAADKGWRAIEAAAYEELPTIYAVTGQTGRRFWEKLGFRLVRVEVESALEEDSGFVRKMREDAIAAGIDPAKLANKYIMRLELG